MFDCECSLVVPRSTAVGDTVEGSVDITAEAVVVGAGRVAEAARPRESSRVR